MPRWKPRFFSIWAGQAVSLLGSMLVQFALVWWLTQTTGSATVLATTLSQSAGVCSDPWRAHWWTAGIAAPY
jgi:hypothetical protein